MFYATSDFIKNHISLCICTLGVAIIGYLGFHAIRWIINKCQKTKKIDQVAKKNLSSLASDRNTPNPLIGRVKLEIPDKITAGQGEYVVFHKLPDGEKKAVSRETFEQVNQVLNQYAPAAIVSRGSESAIEECSRRFEIIKGKVKEIDPSLEIAFVPRTLYELVFIRKCIKEDLKHQKICDFIDPVYHKLGLRLSKGSQDAYDEFSKECSEKKAQRKCWHLCHFDDAGDNDHAGVRDVAYRLNQAIIKAFSPNEEGFTYQELNSHTEREIDFLKAHHKKYFELQEKAEKGEKVSLIVDCSKPGPTTNFGTESFRSQIKPMGIRDDGDAQIIRNAIALECSSIAQKAFLIYRGSDFKKDTPTAGKDEPYSLSYGSSLFAGSIFDGGATAFHFMRKGKNAYAISVPFDQLHSSPFYIPPTRSVSQLFGNGEVFHGRTKIWKGYRDIDRIRGINGLGDRAHLKSNLSKKELIAQFEHYKKEAIQLK